MKVQPITPHDSVLWPVQKVIFEPLKNNATTDVLIVGGGMAGLMAAQSFHAKGRQVMLIEKTYCGAGATGKSSGFITPDSELSLSDIIENYGLEEGKKLWEFIDGGVKAIQNNIQKYNIDCDYQRQDTLVVANTHKDFTNAIAAEHAARIKAGYESRLYDQKTLTNVLGSTKYHGGVAYDHTFGINGFYYCNGLKHVLQQQGVKIYEETPMLELQDKLVKTPYASIKAEHIVVCIDHALHDLETFYDKVYHAQTFLMASAPLTEQQVKQIFPDKPFMVWDTSLIYNYFRITGDNRLLLGGGSLFSTYAKHEQHNNTRMIKQLTSYFHDTFPDVNVHFEYIWPGLIGISKNLFPIAGFDEKHKSIYYISAAAGLPWAAALGMYSAECIAHGESRFNKELSPYRPAALGPITQKILGTKLTFALSNLWSVQSL